MQPSILHGSLTARTELFVTTFGIETYNAVQYYAPLIRNRGFCWSLKKMKHLKYLVALSALLVLPSCGGDGGNSVNDDGNCTSQFVSDYNEVSYEARRNLTSRTDQEEMQRLNSVINACDHFFANHPNISCQAAVNSVSQSVSSSDHNDTCDAARASLKRLRSTPRDTSPAIGTLNLDRLRVKIVAPEAINKMLTKAEPGRTPNFVAVNGKVDSIDNHKPAVTQGAVFCVTLSMDISKTAKTLRDARTMTIISRQEKVDEAKGVRAIVLILDDKSTILSCGKGRMKDVPFTINQIRDAFKGLLEITG